MTRHLDGAHAPAAPWSPLPHPEDGADERIDRADFEVARRPLPYPALVLKGRHVAGAQLRGGEYAWLIKARTKDGQGGGEIALDFKFIEWAAFCFGYKLVRR